MCIIRLNYRLFTFFKIKLTKTPFSFIFLHHRCYVYFSVISFLTNILVSSPDFRNVPFF